jgi:hypothetical protein
VSQLCYNLKVSYGGAATMRKDESKSGFYEIVLDPNGIVWNGSMALYRKSLPTFGEVFAHELGHAVQLFRHPNRSGMNFTNCSAIEYENEARRREYLATGNYAAAVKARGWASWHVGDSSSVRWIQLIFPNRWKV